MCVWGGSKFLIACLVLSCLAVLNGSGTALLCVLDPILWSEHEQVIARLDTAEQLTKCFWP